MNDRADVRQDSQRDFDSRSASNTQQATRGASPQVMSEVRASARGPTDEALLGASPLRNDPSATQRDEVSRASQSSRISQAQSDSQGRSQEQQANQPSRVSEEQRLAMVAPDDGGWPREEIIPDDLDFAPVDGAGEKSAKEDGFSGRWAWPTDGQVVRGFQPDRVGGQGVDIAGVPGQDVKAAMDGTVVYSGRDLSGEGNLIILKHPDDLLSTYSHTRNLYVAEDDVVRAGDSIASLGANENQESVLGFEIRRDGNPLNPMDFLPIP